MRVNKLTFKSGASSTSPGLDLAPGRVTIFIGPNNGGKSRALSEIQNSVAPIDNLSLKIIESAEIERLTDQEFHERISQIQVAKSPTDSPDPGVVTVYSRSGRQELPMAYLRNGLFSSGDVGARKFAAQNFLQYFLLNLTGTNRLELANPQPAQPVGAKATTTISTLLSNDVARHALSSLVLKAFGQYLVIDPTQMTQLRYMLSRAAPPINIERHLTDEAVAFFGDAEPLQDASDGTKAFVGIAAEIIAGDPDIIFVDEPEAFLHPSLGFMLGRFVVSHINADKQLFVSTHSSAFLLGCILSGAAVDVVRLTYRSGEATARHLSSDRLKTLMTDPLFRSAGAVSALFYEGAVITEGDSDRAFYDEINNRLQNFEDRGLSHTTFLNAHNKQTAVNIVKPLRDIGIPAAMILDLDWLKEDGQVWDRYFTAMGAPYGLKSGFSATRRYLREQLLASNPNYKTHGGISLLSTSDQETANDFFDRMEEYGLFTVRRGELESWLSGLQIERTKNRWLATVFLAMGSDPDDPCYIRPAANDVWEFIDRIAKWTTCKDRKGMNGGT